MLRVAISWLHAIFGSKRTCAGRHVPEKIHHDHRISDLPGHHTQVNTHYTLVDSVMSIFSSPIASLLLQRGLAENAVCCSEFASDAKDTASTCSIRTALFTIIFTHTSPTHTAPQV